MRNAKILLGTLLAALSACESKSRSTEGQSQAIAAEHPPASSTNSTPQSSEKTGQAIPVPAAAKDASDYCATNQDEWVSACSARCVAGWEGNSCPNVCTASPPPGFVMIDHRDFNVSENNGGASISVIPADSKFDYKLAIESAYKSAIDAAGKYGNDEAKANLNDEMKRSLSIAESFASSNQTLRLSVNASKHGSIFDRRRGWSDHRVEMKIRCVVPPDLQQKLYEKYGLK